MTPRPWMTCGELMAWKLSDVQPAPSQDSADAGVPTTDCCCGLYKPREVDKLRVLQVCIQASADKIL